MGNSGEFLEYIRSGNWTLALSMIESGSVTSTLQTPDDSVFHWLIDINAPTHIVLALLKHCILNESINPNRLGLLEKCMHEASTKENAFATFSALLEYGVSPNAIAESGATLLQKAMELNKIREVTELLRYGIDPNRMSIFGIESTSNLQDAEQIGNEAAKLVLAKFA